MTHAPDEGGDPAVGESPAAHEGPSDDPLMRLVAFTRDAGLEAELTAVAHESGVAIDFVADLADLHPACRGATGLLWDLDGATELVEAAARLDQAGPLRGVPIGGVTSRRTVPPRVQALRAGAALVLERPLGPTALRSAAARLADLQRASSPLVLVVDDDAGYCEEIAAILEADALRCTSLRGPVQLLDQLRSLAPQLLLIDAVMPGGVDGFDLCRLLRASERWAELPVVLTTAWSDPAMRVAAFEAGADDYLPKPFTSAELLARVRARLERGRLGQRIRVLNEELQRRAADLQTLHSEAREFAYSISHDLRGPLVNVKGFTAELKHSLDDLEQELDPVLDQLPEAVRAAVRRRFAVDLPEALGFMRHGLDRMDQLVQAVLRLARTGHRALQAERLDPGSVARHALTSFAHRVEQAGVTVEVSPCPPVIADPVALLQVFENLIGNAIQYLDPARPGTIQVEGEVVGDEVVITIHDNGRGIGEPDRDRIFMPFARADQTRDGEGIGLACVRTLVRRHGGRLGCSSEPGVGSRFWFSLPASE